MDAAADVDVGAGAGGPAEVVSGLPVVWGAGYKITVSIYGHATRDDLARGAAFGEVFG